MNWWQRLRNRDRLERELDAELRYHLEREVADYVRMGLPEAEARRRARLDLGGDDLLKEVCRDARGTRWVSDTGQDLRVAARLLLKDRWFMLPAVFTLALGIGMNGAMFAIVSAMVRGLPIDRPDRVMSLHARDAAGHWRGRGVSYQDFRDYQRASTTFAGLAAFSQAVLALGEDGRAAERTSAAYVSANTFSLLGERPILGRDFSAEDDSFGAPAVVILGSRVWTSRYNADPAVIGRSVWIDGTRTTIIGVMPEGFRFPIVSDAWLPLARRPGLADDARDRRSLQVFGRLAEQSSAAGAQAEVDAIASRLSRDYPATNARTGTVVAAFPGPFAPVRILIALQMAVGFILLLACINVAKLLLARSIGRSDEFSLRAALGASRGRIVRQLLIESSTLALPAGALGVAIAMAGLWFFESAVAGITFPYYVRWSIDASVGLFVAAACMTTALLVGLLPALHALRAAVRRSLVEGLSASRSGVRRRRVTTVLLTIEVALTLVLLAGAGLMMRSFLAVYRADSIVDASRIVVSPLTLADAKYPTPEQRGVAFERLAGRIDRLPGVWATAFASAVPFAGGPFRLLTRDGHRGAPGDVLPRVSYVTVRGRYFDALGLRMLRGRTFSDRDAMPGSEGTIVNQRLATTFFPGEDPIGQRICLALPNPGEERAPSCATIVGVSPTVRQQYFQEIDPVAYTPDRADSSERMLIVHAGRPPDALAPLIRAELFAFDPDIALNAIEPLEQFMTGSRWGHRVFGGMLSVLALVGLLLAAVGLYAVTAFAAVSRTREIGLRLALGARPAGLVWLLVKDAAGPLLAGLGIGLAGALGVGRLVQGFLIETTPAEPAVLLGIIVTLGATSFAATVWPARRATRLEALAALRYE